MSCGRRILTFEGSWKTQNFLTTLGQLWGWHGPTTSYDMLEGYCLLLWQQWQWTLFLIAAAHLSTQKLILKRPSSSSKPKKCPIRTRWTPTSPVSSSSPWATRSMSTFSAETSAGASGVRLKKTLPSSLQCQQSSKRRTTEQKDPIWLILSKCSVKARFIAILAVEKSPL